MILKALFAIPLLLFLNSVAAVCLARPKQLHRLRVTMDDWTDRLEDYWLGPRNSSQRLLSADRMIIRARLSRAPGELWPILGDAA